MATNKQTTVITLRTTNLLSSTLQTSTPYTTLEGFQMNKRRLTLVFLVMFPILMGVILTPNTNPITHESIQSSFSSPESGDERMDDAFAISQDTQEGVLDPNTITQSGYQTTDEVRARTDSGNNAKQNITVDDANDWKVSKSEVQVENLKKLYAVNGTFDDEVSPWTNYTYDPSGGDQTQSAVWNTTEGYVSCVNYGEYTHYNNKDDTYTHYLDTSILWEQTVVNTPQTDNFSLSFSYRYVSGPVDIEPYDFSGDVELRMYIHTDTYYLSIAKGDERGVWYSITDYPIEITGAPSTFTVGIGIYVEYANLVLTENGDYDEDGYPDGLVNAEKIEVNLDNFEFKSRTPVAYDNVELAFDVEGTTEPISGPTGGIGTSTVTNPSLWDVNPLQIEITANDSVSFDYYVTTYFQRDINSSWTTGLSQYGVAYSIDVGQSADLELYTYVTTSSDYENLTLDIQFPKDWENTTIWDPLQNDITGLCTITTGNIHVPNGLFDRVGWWKITHQSFNYAKSIDVQIYDTGVWTSGSLFRPGNSSRTEVELGTLSETPTSGSSISIDWVMPNSTIWTTDSVSSIVSGIAQSSSHTFGGMNTSAGLWEVQVFWNNGTELAYGIDSFDLYHSASAIAQYPSIEADHGLIIANQIILTDVDNGEYLLDDGVSISANWSETTVDFSQNYAKNWWQADFDTSLLEAGEYTIVVSITRAYFSPISIQFTVVCTFETDMEITNAGEIPVDRGLNEIFTVEMNYSLWNGTGITGADIFISHLGPIGGLNWSNFNDYDNGQYSVDIICNMSGTYPISITLNKTYHYDSVDTFTLIIGETGTSLSILNGSADIVLFGENYTLVLEYLNSTSDGLSGANLQVEAITPSIGLGHSGFTPIGNGLYNITFIPNEAGTYSIVMSASLLNHETQYITFTLTSTKIPTILTSTPSETTVAINQTFTFQLRFMDESFNPIDDANISLLNPPSGLSVSDAIPAGSGYYNITLESTIIQTFDLLFRATADNYQSSSAGFTFVVTEIQTSMSFAGDISSTQIDFAKAFELILYYDVTYTGQTVQGADITILPAVSDLAIDVTEYTGYYMVTIRGNGVGSWALSIIANRTDYRLASKSFIIEVVEIDTAVEGSSPLETLLVDRAYDFTFNYIFEANSSYISGASMTPSGAAAVWVTYTELVSGQYSITLTPEELGEHSVVLTFTRVGFEPSSFRLTFTVGKVPIAIEVLQGLSGPENAESSLNVRVTEADTGDPVSGLQIFCYIINPIGDRLEEGSIALTETDTAGVYSGTIPMPVAEGEYQLEITCEGAHYIMSAEYKVNLEPVRSLTTMLWVTTMRYYPVIIVLGEIGRAHV